MLFPNDLRIHLQNKTNNAKTKAKQSHQTLLPVGRQDLQHRHHRRLERQRHGEREQKRRHHLAAERDGHRVEAEMQRRIAVQRHQPDDDRMHQVRTVGDPRERVDARRRQQRVHVATVAGRAGDHDPGQRQCPRRVRQRTEGGRRQARQLRIVQAVDQVEQGAAGGQPAGHVGQRTHADLAVGLEEQPADAHADQVGAEARPRLVVDLVEQGERIVRVGHVVVGERKVAGGRPRGDHEDGQDAGGDLEVTGNVCDTDGWRGLGFRCRRIMQSALFRFVFKYFMR